MDNLEYTQEMYEKDYEICRVCFYKNFKYLVRYKDDFINYAMANAYKYRFQWNESGITYFNFMYEYFKGYMLFYYTRYLKRHITNTISTEENVAGCDKLIIADIIKDSDNLEEDFINKCNYEKIKKIAYDLINNLKYNKNSHNKEIFTKYVDNDFSTNGLYKYFCVTRENIYSRIKIFHNKLKEELIKNGFGVGAKYE